MTSSPLLPQAGKTSEELRAAFEAWAKSQGVSVERASCRSNATYMQYDTYLAWLAWLAASSARSEEMEALRTALTNLCKVFPIDSDMLEAGWSQTEIEAACSAYDAARAALTPPTQGPSESA